MTDATGDMVRNTGGSECWGKQGASPADRVRVRVIERQKPKSDVPRSETLAWDLSPSIRLRPNPFAHVSAPKEEDAAELKKKKEQAQLRNIDHLAKCEESFTQPRKQTARQKPRAFFSTCSRLARVAFST